MCVLASAPWALKEDTEQKLTVFMQKMNTETIQVRNEKEMNTRNSTGSKGVFFL